MVLSYAVIMVMFLGALVPAVANRNFQHQSRERQVRVPRRRRRRMARVVLLENHRSTTCVLFVRKFKKRCAYHTNIA